ncbi:MAG: CDP-alcohol phosphatidyltransferase family protein [Woeseia sp.]|nr:CDP-alcohol phosphatidyltransferase family protein [Woeseia sp.]MBT8095465.1 CDP-alcohol phosphatidyltransferase family protein [Woeseia sp.]NNE60501.1 CDP-alcohol phosphatidyltransferase family protein [Woeseia sp.]NNL54808.1 CDP-alcohol phosphatidyltransferase family protein [Woeseia sp.]
MRLHWLPNAISILRIALVLPILWLLKEDKFVTALVLFILAAISDGIDGWLAKRFDWRTRLGALLDPIADKLLIAGVFAFLILGDHIPLWLGIMVIVRDVVIVGGATAYNFLVRPVQGRPTRISKLNTALELLLVVFVLARAAFEWPPKISVTVLGAAVLVTVVVSGIDYVLSWSRRARSSLQQG